MTGHLSRLLIILIVVDLAFLGLHILQANEAPFFWRSMFRLDVDGGPAEFFQYTKQLSSALLLASLSFRIRSLLIAFVAFTCILLFVEDAFRIHEMVSSKDFASMIWNQSWNLEFRRLVQLYYGMAIGSIIFALVAVLWIFSTSESREIAGNLLIAIAAIGVFGVFVDAIPTGPQINPGLLSALNGFEETGEHFATSILLWLSARNWVRYC